jgi:hypothetical protein
MAAITVAAIEPTIKGFEPSTTPPTNSPTATRMSRTLPTITTYRLRE